MLTYIVPCTAYASTMNLENVLFSIFLKEFCTTILRLSSTLQIHARLFQVKSTIRVGFWMKTTISEAHSAEGKIFLNVVITFSYCSPWAQSSLWRKGGMHSPSEFSLNQAFLLVYLGYSQRFPCAAVVPVCLKTLGEREKPCSPVLLLTFLAPSLPAFLLTSLLLPAVKQF